MSALFRLPLDEDTMMASPTLIIMCNHTHVDTRLSATQELGYEAINVPCLTIKTTYLVVNMYPHFGCTISINCNVNCLCGVNHEALKSALLGRPFSSTLTVTALKTLQPRAFGSLKSVDPWVSVSNYYFELCYY